MGGAGATPLLNLNGAGGGVLLGATSAERATLLQHAPVLQLLASFEISRDNFVALGLSQALLELRGLLPTFAPPQPGYSPAPLAVTSGTAGTGAGGRLKTERSAHGAGGLISPRTAEGGAAAIAAALTESLTRRSAPLVFTRVLNGVPLFHAIHEESYK